MTALPRLPARPADSHKGRFGRVGVIGGAPGMAGAVLLAGRAALAAGAGWVVVAPLDTRLFVDPLQPELMFDAPERLVADARLDVLAAGPGLGGSAEALRLLDLALDTSCPLVLDADALNGLAARPELAARCRARTAPTLLTPHPGEAARLLDCDVAAVQRARADAARQIAERFQAVVVLKGRGSELAGPDGWQVKNATGNPALAAPGMGDVLTGIAAAFAARLPPAEALRLAVHLHGEAADAAVAAGAGHDGFTASQLIDWIHTSLAAHVGRPPD